MIIIECFAGKEETIIIYVTRKGRERRHKVSQAGVNRLSKLINFQLVRYSSSIITCRPFCAGLGWVVEITEGRCESISLINPPNPQPFNLEAYNKERISALLYAKKAER